MISHAFEKNLKILIIEQQSSCILANVALFGNVTSQLYHIIYILFGNVAFVFKLY